MLISLSPILGLPVTDANVTGEKRRPFIVSITICCICGIGIRAPFTEDISKLLGEAQFMACIVLTVISTTLVWELSRYHPGHAY